MTDASTGADNCDHVGNLKNKLVPSLRIIAAITIDCAGCKSRVRWNGNSEKRRSLKNFSAGGQEYHWSRLEAEFPFPPAWLSGALLFTLSRLSLSLLKCMTIRRRDVSLPTNCKRKLSSAQDALTHLYASLRFHKCVKITCTRSLRRHNHFG